MSDPNDPFADFEPYEPPAKPERAKREKAPREPREPREPRAKKPRASREPGPKREKGAGTPSVMAGWPDEPLAPRPAEPSDGGGGGGDRRLLVILSSIAGLLVVAVVVVFAIYLTQQSQRQEPAADPVPTAPATQSIPQPSATPQPSESPSAPAATSGVAVTADGFTISDASGSTVFTHAWADDAAPAVAALTELFGAAPTEDFQNGDAENYAYRIYAWEGFRLYDVYLNESNRPRSEVPAPTFISYDSDIDVPVTDDFGVGLDMSADEVAALGPDSGQGGSFVFGSDRNTFYQDGQRRFGAAVTVEGSKVTVTYTFRAGR
ncbi:hypothetical protein [Microbacterium paludicola]|uniref:hypothetical protein n=1 Tax=Microbacterium paludicola TaxID=300019 RepID=UPI000903B2AB|nr:hypothetical protein [Microbacterium paludicola]APF34515.1 hypothetical protein BO218_10215 [Microbacterium paludicola]